MENASKALLIAGAILLVIAIIAIAVGIVSRTRGTIDVAGNQIDAMEVKMHNNQFTIYEGRVTGSDVKECISKVLSNNTKTNDINMKVLVVIDPKTGTDVNYGENKTVTGNNTLSSENITSNAIYKGITSIDSQGIINIITFQEQ